MHNVQETLYCVILDTDKNRSSMFIKFFILAILSHDVFALTNLHLTCHVIQYMNQTWNLHLKIVTDHRLRFLSI